MKYDESLEELDQCIEEATKRYDLGKLKLCPEGYCKAKMKFDVYPSAYANLYASNICSSISQTNFEQIDILDSLPKRSSPKRSSPKRSSPTQESKLKRWVDEKWVNVCDRKKGKYPPCGRKKGNLIPEEYPYCRPSIRISKDTPKTVGEMTQKEINEMCRTKKSRAQGVGGKPVRNPIAKK